MSTSGYGSRPRVPHRKTIVLGDARHPKLQKRKEEARRSLENVGEALGTSEKPRTNDDAEDDDDGGSVYECCRV